MRLAADSHARLERFFREFTRDASLALPPVYVHTGAHVRWLTKAFRIGAITLGRHVFVAPALVRDDETGRRVVEGWLAAHEVAHVLQYERAGFAGFLLSYLRAYVAALWRGGRTGVAAHWDAYGQIPYEREAREAEAGFVAWAAGGAARVS